MLPDLERFRPVRRARRSRGATGVLVGSGHTAERLRQAVDDPEANAKVRLGPPGVDIELFAPLAGERRSGAPSARASWRGDAVERDDRRGRRGSSLGPRRRAPPPTALEWFAEARRARG